MFQEIRRRVVMDFLVDIVPKPTVDASLITEKKSSTAEDFGECESCFPINIAIKLREDIVVSKSALLKVSSQTLNRQSFC